MFISFSNGWKMTLVVLAGLPIISYAKSVQNDDTEDTEEDDSNGVSYSNENQSNELKLITQGWLFNQSQEPHAWLLARSTAKVSGFFGEHRKLEIPQKVFEAQERINQTLVTNEFWNAGTLLILSKSPRPYDRLSLFSLLHRLLQA
jgi:hypothetical protein